jgi:hypothetical protein
MRKIVFTLMFLIFQTAFALQFDGDVVRIADKNYINIKSENKNYLLVGNSPITAMYLNKLSDGDFVSVEGNKTSNLTMMSVDAINYVGLRDLLGTWTADGGFCYNFNSHTDFSITAQIGKTCLSAVNGMDDYTYLINPHSQKWVMLVAGQRGSYVGDVSIMGKKKVDIVFYDSEGAIVRHLSLKKVSE